MYVIFLFSSLLSFLVPLSELCHNSMYFESLYKVSHSCYGLSLNGDPIVVRRRYMFIKLETPLGPPFMPNKLVHDQSSDIVCLHMCCDWNQYHIQLVPTSCSMVLHISYCNILSSYNCFNVLKSFIL